MIKVGAKVRLKNYQLHTDWLRRDGQTAVVRRDFGARADVPDSYRWELLWCDKGTSHAPTSALVPTELRGANTEEA